MRVILKITILLYCLLGWISFCLGKGKGTPMLKQGIKCTAVENVDSEMSDAGFPPRKVSAVNRAKLLPPQS